MKKEEILFIFGVHKKEQPADTEKQVCALCDKDMFIGKTRKHIGLPLDHEVKKKKYVAIACVEALNHFIAEITIREALEQATLHNASGVIN